MLLPSASRVEEQELGRSVLDASKLCPVPSVILVGLRSVQFGALLKDVKPGALRARIFLRLQGTPENSLPLENVCALPSVASQHRLGAQGGRDGKRKALM